MNAPKQKKTIITIPKINLNKIQLQTETSNDNNDKINRPYLSYTFRANHDSLKHFKEHFKSYLFDLEKTLSLNIEMIHKIIPSMINNQQHKEILMYKINNISSLLIKNKELKNQKEKTNSKLLISNQILEATKRDIDERKDVLDEKIEELKVHNARKVINSNHYISNFKELEMYIQTECLNTKWASLFYKYDLITFLSQNELLIINKKTEEQNKQNLLYNISVLKKENKEIRKNTLVNERITKLRNLEYYYIENNQSLERKKNSLLKLLNSITLKNKLYCVDNGINRDIDSIFETVFTDTASNFKTNVTNKICILSTNISKIEDFKSNIS